MKTYKSKKSARKFKDGKEVKEVKKRPNRSTPRGLLKMLLKKRRAERELDRRMEGKPREMMAERPKLGNDERVRSRMKPIKRKRGLGY
tara:strand:+ start:841 stop:1104 length:264 start_codon:yes stop_codon:yes gene_type:complete